MSEKQNILRTIDIKPSSHGEIIKAAETIAIFGMEKLTLQDQRVWNALLESAHGSELGHHDRYFKINITTLRANHNNNDRFTMNRLSK